MQPQATNPSVEAPSALMRLLLLMRRSTYAFPLVGFFAVSLVMVITTDNFLSADNFMNIARQVSINAIIAIGMTCAILTGGIDLSVGAVMALSGTLMAGMMVNGVPPAAAIPLGLGVGLAFGLFNGFFVAYAGMPPIIVTLATMGIARGIAREAVMPRGHDLDAIADAVSPNAAIVYLANPNNPTGTWFGADAFAAFMSRVPENVLVVVDEAYAEFADAPDYASALALLPRHPNLIVTRTFSKAYALAGLRIGYAVAHPDCIAVLERLRESFNVNMTGLAAAEAALGDEAHLRWSLARNAEQRTSLAAALQERGHFVHPSMTNCLLVDFGNDTARIEAGLIERGVVLRPMAGYGLPECLRITVGDASENRRLIFALDAIAGEPSKLGSTGTSA